MTCRMLENRPEILEDYLAGALDRQETDQLDLHLVACSECREGLADARQAGDLLRHAYPPAAEASAAFWTRLGAHLRAEEDRRSGGDFWRSVEQLAWRLSFGAAALVMLLLGIVIGTQLPPQTSESMGVRAESRDIFPEPGDQVADSNEVLVDLASASSRNGR